MDISYSCRLRLGIALSNPGTKQRERESERDIERVVEREREDVG